MCFSTIFYATNQRRRYIFLEKSKPELQGKTTQSSQPRIMGILNVTPDSFYDGGLHEDPSAALEHARKMIDQGADIIDIGAASSRPGAALSHAEEEIKRLAPVVSSIRQENFLILLFQLIPITLLLPMI